MGSREAILDFTIFGDDGLTPWFGSADGDGEVVESDFQTPSDALSPAHERPYLKTPKNFSATEIKFIEGSSDIGSVSVGVMDVRLDSTDQTSGQVTSRISEAVGRRAVLRRWVPDTEEWIKIFEGVVHSYSVDQTDLLVYWFHVRDTREFSRGGELFSSNYVIFGKDGDQGPADPYGRLPARGASGALLSASGRTGYLLPAVEPWESVSAHGFDHFEFGSDPDPSDGIHFGYTAIGGVALSISIDPTKAPDLEKGVPAIFKDLAWPTQDADGSYHYRDFWIRWRPKGGTDEDWVELRDMPRNEYKNAAEDRFLRVRTRSGTVSGGAFALYMASEDPNDLPAQGQEFEMQVLASKISESTPFFWDNGTLGDLLVEIQNGDHTDSVPQERYDSAALAEFAEDSPRGRFIVKAPVTDRRKWIEENIFKPTMVAPGLGEDLSVRPVSWNLPANTETIETLDPDTIQPIGEWEEVAGAGVAGIEFRYFREHLDPKETVIERRAKKFLGIKYGTKSVEVVRDDRIDWERLVETEIVFERANPNAPPGAKVLKYEPITIRSFAGVDGAPFSGDVQDELGWRLATRIFETVTKFFAGGSVRYEALVAATSENLRRRVGEWVRVLLPWMPEYTTAKRGARRFMQITRISDEDPHLRKILVQDGGVPAPPDDAEADGGVDCLSGGELYVSPEGYSERVFVEDGFLVNACSEAITIKKILLIGGGGSGGDTGTRGGGGAGGVTIAEDVVVGPGESIPITVGAGGDGNGAAGEKTTVWVDGDGFALDPLSDPAPNATSAGGGGFGGLSNGGDGQAPNGSGGGGGEGTIGGGSPSTTSGGSGVGSGNDGGGGGEDGPEENQAGGGGGSFGGVGGTGGGILQNGTPGDGGPETLIEAFGLKAGGGGQGGNNTNDSVVASGVSGVGYGAGGGGSAENSDGSLLDPGKPGGKGVVAVVYAGGSVGLEAPAISSTSLDSKNRAEICVDEADWPVVEYDDYRVAVEFALGPSEPGANSGEWQLAGYLDAAGCVKTDPIPVGATLWPRTRAEAKSLLPSAGGGGASQVDSPQTPALVRYDVEVDPDTGIATVTWSPNDFSSTVEIRALVHDPDASLPDPLPLIDEVDASLGTYELSTLFVDEGQLITVDLEAKASPGSLSKDGSGSLVFYVAKQVGASFDVSDWTAQNAALGNPAGDDTLRIENGAPGNFGAREDSNAGRSKSMVRAEMKYNRNEGFGPAVHVGADADHLITLRFNLATDEVRLQEWDGGGSNLATQAVPAKATGTYYWGSVFADGLDAAGYDFDSDSLVSGTAAAINSGRAGHSDRTVTAAGSAETRTRRFYHDSDRFLEVSGLDAGYKAKVLDAADNVLAEATEVSGLALVDLIGVLPTEAVALIVTDSGDVELARYEETADYMAGGDTHTFTGEPGATGEVYRTSEERPSPAIATPASISSKLDRLVFDDDLNLVTDDDLNLVTDE